MHWISVTQKLPAVNEKNWDQKKYLICEKTPMVASWRKGNWINQDLNGLKRICNPTHWMEVPELPKG